jgi:hypothetical protein
MVVLLLDYSTGFSASIYAIRTEFVVIFLNSYRTVQVNFMHEFYSVKIW